MKKHTQTQQIRGQKKYEFGFGKLVWVKIDVSYDVLDDKSCLHIFENTAWFQFHTNLNIHDLENKWLCCSSGHAVFFYAPIYSFFLNINKDYKQIGHEQTNHTTCPES